MDEYKKYLLTDQQINTCAIFLFAIVLNFQYDDYFTNLSVIFLLFNAHYTCHYISEIIKGSETSIVKTGIIVWTFRIGVSLLFLSFIF